MKIQITNTYEDGHTSQNVVEVDVPEPDVSEVTADDGIWWDENVYEHTGDGHGVSGLGSCYEAIILEADDPDLIGHKWEWV